MLSGLMGYGRWARCGYKLPDQFRAGLFRCARGRSYPESLPKWKFCARLVGQCFGSLRGVVDAWLLEAWST
jgi:hypothetical protein